MLQTKVKFMCDSSVSQSRSGEKSGSSPTCKWGKSSSIWKRAKWGSLLPFFICDAGQREIYLAWTKWQKLEELRTDDCVSSWDTEMLACFACPNVAGWHLFKSVAIRFWTLCRLDWARTVKGRMKAEHTLRSSRQGVVLPTSMHEQQCACQMWNRLDFFVTPVMSAKGVWAALHHHGLSKFLQRPIQPMLPQPFLM